MQIETTDKFVEMLCWKWAKDPTFAGRHVKSIEDFAFTVFLY